MGRLYSTCSWSGGYDDLKLLFHLDWFVNKMLKRFGIDREHIRIKKFVKTYHEITKNLSKTTYIPNFSEFDYDQQRIVLSEIFGMENVPAMSDFEVDQHFSKIVFRTIRELEQDIQTFS